jgi:hypothetical protein
MFKRIFLSLCLAALTACGGGGGGGSNSTAGANCSSSTTLGSATFGSGCFN